VDAAAGRQGDVGVGVDGVFGDVVGAGGEEVDEFEVRAVGGGRGERGEGYEDGFVFVDFWMEVLHGCFLSGLGVWTDLLVLLSVFSMPSPR